MKRIFAVIILISLMIVPCFAEENIEVFIDGEALSFDVPPAISEGRTMVPLRKIAESCGYNVTWNESNKRIGLGRGDILLNLYIGKSVIYVRDAEGSKEFYIDAPPYIEDGRTLVPLRVISEYMGYEVIWNEKTRTVSINSTTVIKPLKQA